MMIDFDKNIKLEKWDVLLRPWSSSDEMLITDSIINPEIWKFTTGIVTTTEEIRDYVETALADRKNHKRYSFAICVNGSNKIIGSSSFGNISSKDKRMEIGWTWLAKEFHGTGLNNIVKYLMMQYGFEELNAHRIEFKTDNSNPRSCRALEKVGAKKDGVLRSHTLMHDGRYRDTAFFSVLETEWNDVNRHLYNLIENNEKKYMSI